MTDNPGETIGNAGGGIKATMTKKVGPLPVWGYGAIAVGGFVAYRFLQSRSGSSAAVADPNATIPAAGALNTPSDAGTTTISGQLSDLQGTDSAILTELQKIGGMNGTPAPVVPSTTTPISSADGWSATVHNIYSELLQRQGGQVDPSGANYWQSQVAGHNPLEILLQVDNTPEAQQLAANDPVKFITGQYQYGLGRTPSSGEIAGWQKQISEQGVAHETQAFAAAAAKEHPGGVG